jgi:ABC-2 type transport system permease protein
MRGWWRRVVQVVGFLRKELMDVVRQPRLVLTLVFGPFLILLLFGIGYDNQPPALRTVFVAPPGTMYQQVVDQYSGELSDWIKPIGFVPDEAAAQAQLERHEIDVIVVFPADPMASVLQGKQAMIRVVHDKLDPIQQTAIGFATKLAVDKVNSAILARIVGAGQDAVQPLGPARQAILSASQQLGRAVQSTDPAPARAAAADLRQRAAQVDTVVTATTSFLHELRGDGADSQAGLLDQAHAALTDLQASAQTVEAGAGPQSQAAAATAIQTVANVDALLGQLQTVDPAVLVAPFSGEAEVAVAKPVGITDFYAPGAIVLLIQHLGVTFGALSFVRDRALGLFEMLRVGPVTTAQTLLGKYGAYGIIGAVVAAALTFLVVRGLHVPLVGQAGWVAAILGLVLVASLGVGFFISLLAKSDSQAVQFAMIVLLASLFFGGFFLSLDQLTFPVELISFVLPVRYGISALQDVMLRGAPPSTGDLAGLITLAVLGYSSAWYLLRRQLRVV